MLDAINRIADFAESFGLEAGVGCMETAGMIVSFLAANPQHVDAFERDPWFVVARLDFGAHAGKLTWHASGDGSIQRPLGEGARVTTKCLIAGANKAASQTSGEG